MSLIMIVLDALIRPCCCDVVSSHYNRIPVNDVQARFLAIHKNVNLRVTIVSVPMITDESSS